ncbi:MAG: hypothetical protein LIO44_07415 [Eubacterium sp.]|nr:hypothetical protein [Eubacterium sp.]
MAVKLCKYCKVPLKKDWIALNKKLISPDLKDFACISCLADEFDCQIDDLEIKIEEFKEQGCLLFT